MRTTSPVVSAAPISSFVIKNHAKKLATGGKTFERINAAINNAITGRKGANSFFSMIAS